jgi:hypothetical protein
MSKFRSVEFRHSRQERGRQRGSPRLARLSANGSWLASPALAPARDYSTIAVPHVSAAVVPRTLERRFNLGFS